MSTKKDISNLKKKIEELEKEIEQKEGNKEDKKKKLSSKRAESVKKDGKLVPFKVLLKWKAPVRVFMARDKAWFLKVAIVALLLIIFFAFLQDFIIILVVCVMVLITFLLASIPPEKVTHQITSYGIKSMDKLYKWKELEEFYVAEKLGQKILYVKTKMRFPSRLVLVINRKDELKIVEILINYLDYKEYEEKQSWISKISDGVTINPDKYAEVLERKEEK